MSVCVSPTPIELSPQARLDLDSDSPPPTQRPNPSMHAYVGQHPMHPLTGHDGLCQPPPDLVAAPPGASESELVTMIMDHGGLPPHHCHDTDSARASPPMTSNHTDTPWPSSWVGWGRGWRFFSFHIRSDCTMVQIAVMNSVN